MRDYQPLFQELLRAESEGAVISVIRGWNLLDRSDAWRPFGDKENNFSTVGNQHADPTGALVEKAINAIDARLMAACYRAGIDPEGPDAPETMRAASEQLFGIHGGRLGDLTGKEQRELAAGIELVAVGTKANPNYLIVDTGEGQTPATFPATFLSIGKSNKLRIPFVQGKFNSGGTGVLQFCGTENFQLIASRRDSAAPRDDDDPRADHWGFTLVRRLPPAEGRRNSMYVYLAPDGVVPAFSAPELQVLPGDSVQGKPGAPYQRGIEHGTVVKLYDYRWKAKSIATTDARFELEKYLHAPCLPIRITETRAYRANYYSTTVAGIWAAIEEDESARIRSRVEEGFPASASLTLPQAGQLDYKLVVFREEMSARRIPSGVVFTMNGQVHGELPADFIARRLKYEYLKGYLLVSVDCSHMQPRAREDFFPGARDRIRRNETYYEIVAALEQALREHPGLRELNSARRTQRLEKALSSEEDVIRTLNDLLNADPALRALFDLGDRVVSSVGPGETKAFKGRRFPTYFRLRKGPKDHYVKPCAVNRACKLFFVTDAVNDYFDRDQAPGRPAIETPALVEYQQLWNGVYTLRLRPPKLAVPGDEIPVTVTVTDEERESRGEEPFVTTLSIDVGKPIVTTSEPGRPNDHKRPQKGKKTAPSLALPNITTVRKGAWEEWDPPFTEDDGLRVMRDGAGGYDYIVNLDNRYLLTQLTQKNPGDRELLIHWFKYGLAISAMGIIQHSPNGKVSGEDILSRVNDSTNGIASVIIPIIRSLHRGPVPG